MKTKVMVMAGIGLSALGLASCSSSSTAAPVTTLPKLGNTKTSSVATPVASTTKVGFNSTRTVFVLPHGLGDLPAPELALAKADPAYAAGLADLGKWSSVKLPASALVGQPSGSPSTLWFYGGSYQANQLNLLTTIKLEQEQAIYALGLHIKETTLGSGSVNVNTVQVQPPAPGQAVTLPSNDTVITATPLEIEAAPVGNHAFQGNVLPSFCTPVAYAWINTANQVVNVPGLSAITAGPSAVFAVSSIGPTANTYDQGVSSCQGFN